MLFFDLCRFRKGPQDLPFSQALLLSSIMAYAILGFLMLYIDSGWFNAIMQVSVGALLLLAFAKIILLISRKPGRFVQTSSALLGTDALISFFALPIIAGMTTGRVSLLAFAALVALMIWHWLITGHIVRHALSASFSFGLGVAFLYIMASYWLMAQLFP
ncbi:hypothetical protein [Methylotuvimicrobium sp.]|uniref:hypothetical protein n=1 Tax=Methylotuvimicrobium sp. TaxID=2822413 RepID=UPI003D6613A5